MKQFPTKSYTNTQTHYQNPSLVNFYTYTSIVLGVLGVLVTLKIVIRKQQHTHKLQQQIKKLEKIYLLEHKDQNIK
ncbi:hypothetical protein NIES4071_31240 [Calothrix sp. NIES-4071]|nr:hypothetical protein NIES4071_31240 [Calothrix sp. NIES-4071]BAZ57444.1 hypothetical protein NIES4105_31180 [Calothrix sp. NIES-4105]